MKKLFLIFLLSLNCINLVYAMSDDEVIIQNIIIKNSINNYPGFCVCPYSLNADGSYCGQKCAYYNSPNKPLCYPKDVTYEMVDAYRRKKNLWSTNSIQILNNQIKTPKELLLYMH